MSSMNRVNITLSLIFLILFLVMISFEVIKVFYTCSCEIYTISECCSVCFKIYLIHHLITFLFYKWFLVLCFQTYLCNLLIKFIQINLILFHDCTWMLFRTYFMISHCASYSCFYT